MWVGSGCAWIVIFGILLVIARPPALVFVGCATQPDAKGHVDIPKSWSEVPESSFLRCNALKSLYIPDTISNVKKNAFNQCQRLTSVTIGPGKRISFASNTFFNCKALTNLTVETTDYIYFGGGIWAACLSLT